MSAPKTPEGRATALAKLRETMRRRPTTELRQDLERLAKRLRYAGESRQGYREDLDKMRWLLSVASGFIRETPADGETCEHLDAIIRALLGVSCEQNRKWRARIEEERAARERPKQERLRAEGAEILRSIFDAPEPTS